MTDTLRIIPKTTNIEEYRTLMLDKVNKICDNYLGYDENNRNIAAMAIVVIGADGSFSISKNIEKNAGYGGTLFPAIVAEAMRMGVAEDIAIDVFDRGR
jgi:hypothetical protein